MVTTAPTKQSEYITPPQYAVFHVGFCFLGAGIWFALSGVPNEAPNQMVAFLYGCMMAGMGTHLAWRAYKHIADLWEVMGQPLARIYVHTPTTALFPQIKTPNGYAEYVYFLQDITVTHHIKIGHTDNLQRRLYQLDATKSSIEVRLIHYIICENRQETERQLHVKYKDCRQRGEYFALTDQQITELMKG